MERLTILETVNRIIADLHLPYADTDGLRKVQRALRQYIYRKKNGYTAQTTKNGIRYTSEIDPVLIQGDELDMKDWYESGDTIFISENGLKKLILEKRQDDLAKLNKRKRNNQTYARKTC